MPPRVTGNGGRYDMHLSGGTAAAAALAALPAAMAQATAQPPSAPPANTGCDCSGGGDGFPVWAGVVLIILVLVQFGVIVFLVYLRMRRSDKKQAALLSGIEVPASPEVPPAAPVVRKPSADAKPCLPHTTSSRRGSADTKPWSAVLQPLKSFEDVSAASMPASPAEVSALAASKDTITSTPPASALRTPALRRVSVPGVLPLPSASGSRTVSPPPVVPRHRRSTVGHGAAITAGPPIDQNTPFARKRKLAAQETAQSMMLEEAVDKVLSEERKEGPKMTAV